MNFLKWLDDRKKTLSAENEVNAHNELTDISTAREVYELYMDDLRANTPQELLDAEARHNSKFVQSCRNHFESKGFLSEAQLEALTFSGTPNRRARQFHYDYADTYGDNPFDPDRD